MKLLLKILFIISAIISLIIFALFALTLISWINNGGGNVLFPGLGLIVTMSLVVIALFIMTILSFLITFLLYKFAFKTLG